MSTDIAAPIAPSTYTGRYRLRSGPEAMALPEPAWLVDHLLMAGGIAALIGVPAAYKSFIAIDLALSIAAGRPLYGRAVRRGPVVYVAAEGAQSFARRLRGWERAHGIAVPATFHLLADTVHLLDDDDVAELTAALAALPERPAEVVFDTLARAMAGSDENSARDMGIMIDAVERLRAGGASVLLLHHVNKSGTIRGSTALAGALDTLIEAKPSKEHVRLVCHKQKDAEEFAPLTLARRVVDLGDGGTTLAFDAVSAAPARAGISEAMATAHTALAEAGERGMTTKAWEAACKGRGVGHTTFFAALKGLEERGFVAKEGPVRGGRYTVAAPLPTPR